MKTLIPKNNSPPSATKFPIDEKGNSSSRQINGHRRRFFRLMIGSRLLGYLNVLEIGRDLDEIEEENVHFVVQLLAKELYAHLEAGETVRGSRREEFLLGLVRDRFQSREQLLDQAYLARMPEDTFYRVVCSDLRDFLSYNADEDLFHLELAHLFPGSTAVISDRTLFLLVPGEGDIHRPKRKSFWPEKSWCSASVTPLRICLCFGDTGGRPWLL